MTVVGAGVGGDRVGEGTTVGGSGVAVGGSGVAVGGGAVVGGMGVNVGGAVANPGNTVCWAATTRAVGANTEGDTCPAIWPPAPLLLETTHHPKPQARNSTATKAPASHRAGVDFGLVATGSGGPACPSGRTARAIGRPQLVQNLSLGASGLPHRVQNLDIATIQGHEHCQRPLWLRSGSC